MSWERDPLWAKSKVFMERAFEQPRESPLFGLWCAMGLELLARASLASISPTLLAESDRDHRYLLHALGRGSEKIPRRSISATRVITLCQKLFGAFTVDHGKAAYALINRRNDELHTGSAAFDEYTTQQWIAGFYGCCRALTSAMDESLERLFGEEEAAVATKVLEEVEHEVRERVEKLIAAHRKVFEQKPDEEKMSLSEAAASEGERLASRKHHRVTCPACGSIATVQGVAFGPEQVTHGDYDIILRQAVAPQAFLCTACGLKLTEFAELAAGGVGDQYTRTTTLTPDEHYGLLDPDDSEAMMDIAREYFDKVAAEFRDEYDND